MVLYRGVLAATLTDFNLWDCFIARQRDLILIFQEAWHPMKSYNRPEWPILSFYYKFAISVCFHKAFHEKLPVTLIDFISKKRATSCSTCACVYRIVPGFNTCYMEDPVAYRGSVL